jgi:cardiolipin synthase
MWVLDDIALVGSANFNHRSLIHDLEMDVILREPAHVAEAERIFLADQRESREVSLAMMADLPLYKRFFSWIAGWFSYWL